MPESLCLWLSRRYRVYMTRSYICREIKGLVVCTFARGGSLVSVHLRKLSWGGIEKVMISPAFFVERHVIRDEAQTQNIC
jgi:hypothetical protein